MALRKIKLKKGLLIDTVIAAIIVQQAPKFINEYLFKTSPLTGMALEASGAVAAYVTGMLLKKDTVANIGIALAGADIVNEMVGSSLIGLTAGTGDFVQVDSQGNLIPTLSDYTDNPDVMDYSNYQNSY